MKKVMSCVSSSRICTPQTSVQVLTVPAQYVPSGPGPFVESLTPSVVNTPLYGPIGLPVGYDTVGAPTGPTAYPQWDINPSIPNAVVKHRLSTASIVIAPNTASGNLVFPLTVDIAGLNIPNDILTISVSVGLSAGGRTFLPGGNINYVLSTNTLTLATVTGIDLTQPVKVFIQYD